MPSKVNPWLLAARPRTLPAAFAPVMLGSALAAHAHAFQLVPSLLCAAFALLAQIGANFANDYFDFRHGADTPGRLGPTRAVAAGLISPNTMLAATFLTLALAAAAGLGLVFYGGWNLVVIGGASLLGALAYTPLAYYGLGEIFALVFFGFVAVGGTYYVQVGYPPPLPVWITAAACGLLAANILLVNNVRDIATDKPAGKRTLAVRFGRPFAHNLYAYGVIFATVAPIFLYFKFGYPLTVLAAFIVTPLGLKLARALAATPDGDGRRFNGLLALSAQFLALWAALLSIGMVMSPA